MSKQGGWFYSVKIIIILAIVGTGFFCTQKALASQSILISEAQITGGSGKTENDFVELYNPANSPFNLKGYRLVKRTKTGTTDTSIKSWSTDVFVPANSHYLWANSNYSDISVTPNATTTAAISSDNGIAIRFGAADTGAIIDSLAWGQAQNVFIEGSVFPTNPEANQSLERKSNLDTNNNSVDFIIQANPNPQNSDTVVAPPLEEQPAGNGTATSTPEQTSNQTGTSASSNMIDALAVKNNFGDVVINELVSDPTDNETEWIELYNKTSREIDLTGWWIEEGSKAKTKLEGLIGLSGSGRYKIIDKPAGSLNNGGDIIVLYDGSGRIIDQVVYGNWHDGNIEDNAPVAGDPGSTARKFDGYNTFNNLNDFTTTLKPTKGASNIIQTEDETSAQAKAKFDFSGDIFISEILPNPTGDDTKLEFIEIHNAGAREVNLTGWSLSNEDNKKVNWEKIASSTIIKAGEYLAVYRPSSKIILHNDSGQIKLFAPLADRPGQTVEFKNVKEGWSLNLADYKLNGAWVWSETLTPGAANVLKIINHEPEVEFSFKPVTAANIPVVFDSSDTNDQDDDRLKFSWDFGDGFKNNLANPEHTYLKIGIFKVKLAVSDGQATSTKEKSIKIVGSAAETTDTNEIVSPAGGIPLHGNIIISEIFPNPAGADIGKEWLELKNQSQTKINLLNWRLENSNGKFKFKNDLWLEAENFYLLANAGSQLAFKNTDDTVSLYNDSDELIDRVKYTGAIQGEAYARGANGKWFWTTKITPAEENIISLADSKNTAAIKASAAAVAAGSYIETTLEKIKELEIGSLVKVRGLVAVEPGVLGVQIFYIVGSPGLQIYNYKKDFPALKIGDYIEAAGELTQTQGEFRLKTKEKGDIKIIERRQPPLALAINGDQINEENIGQLITITGEITDKKSASLYVDDGSDEIFVYIKQSSGIDTKSLAAGQKVSITGILSKTQTGLRLLPRYPADVAQINSGELTPQVLGEVIGADEWDLAERDKKLELFKYLLVVAGGIIIVLAGLFIKAKRKA